MVATPGMIFVRTLSQLSTTTTKAAHMLQHTPIRGGDFTPMVTLATEIDKWRTF